MLHFFKEIVYLFTGYNLFKNLFILYTYVNICSKFQQRDNQAPDTLTSCESTWRHKVVYLQVKLQSSGLLDPDRMKCRLPCFCYYAKSCKKRGPCWNLSTSMHGLWNIISERYDLIRHSCVRSLYDIHDNSLFNKMNFSELWMKIQGWIQDL